MATCATMAAAGGARGVPGAERRGTRVAIIARALTAYTRKAEPGSCPPDALAGQIKNDVARKTPGAVAACPRRTDVQPAREPGAGHGGGDPDRDDDRPRRRAAAGNRRPRADCSRARRSPHVGHGGPPSPPAQAGHPLLRQFFFLLGILLIIGSPLVGAIPGPGGVIVFAAGLAPRPQEQRVGEAPICPLQAPPSQQGPLGRLGHAPDQRAAAQSLHRAVGAGSVIEVGREPASGD